DQVWRLPGGYRDLQPDLEVLGRLHLQVDLTATAAGELVGEFPPQRVQLRAALLGPPVDRAVLRQRRWGGLDRGSAGAAGDPDTGRGHGAAAAQEDPDQHPDHDADGAVTPAWRWVRPRRRACSRRVSTRGTWRVASRRLAEPRLLAKPRLLSERRLPGRRAERRIPTRGWS